MFSGLFFVFLCFFYIVSKANNWPFSSGSCFGSSASCSSCSGGFCFMAATPVPAAAPDPAPAPGSPSRNPLQFQHPDVCPFETLPFVWRENQLTRSMSFRNFCPGQHTQQSQFTVNQNVNVLFGGGCGQGGGAARQVSTALISC